MNSDYGLSPEGVCELGVHEIKLYRYQVTIIKEIVNRSAAEFSGDPRRDIVSPQL